ncbi:hypothetical protein M8J77_018393 [Diaphorina citri]|nr:hypothetical protein M8J77_018393 [Diaphorina citri]
MTSLGLLDKFSIFVVICVVLLTNEKSVTSQHAVKQPPHRLEASRYRSSNTYPLSQSVYNVQLIAYT